MEHQREVFSTVSDLVEQLSDNSAARMTAKEMAERVQRAEPLKGAASEAGFPFRLVLLQEEREH